MPFNASGFFQRLFNWRNDRDAGIKILAERMDQEMDGIVAGINDIVSNEVDWKGSMTGVFGTAAAPAYSFQEDPNTGVYRVSADVLGLSVGGTKKAEVTATGLNVSGSVTATGLNVSGTTTLNWANVNDGAGSGADADLLDGQQGSFYQDAANLIAGTLPNARLASSALGHLNGVSKSGDTMTGNLTIGDASNRTPSGGTNHIQAFGSGYTGHVSLDGDGMWVGHNSTARDLIFDIANVEKARLDTAGRLTVPGTPQFRAIKTGHATSSQTLVFDSTTFNVGSHYNASNGRFTAPVNGLYLFEFVTLYYNTNSGTSYVQLYKNGGGYDNGFGYCASISASYISLSCSALMQMSAGDYATVAFVHGGPNLHSGFTKFSGMLVG